MIKDTILHFNPFKLTGTEGFMNYKMSGGGQGSGDDNKGGKTGGAYIVFLIVLLALSLLKACSS